MLLLAVGSSPSQSHQEDGRSAVDMAWLQSRLGKWSDPKLFGLCWIVEVLKIARYH